MTGASADVSRNKNAACPLGVATDGRFVPVLMLTASIMMAGGRSDDMRGVIADHIEPFDPNDEQQRLYRVAEATYLMWMSPEFAVQR